MPENVHTDVNRVVVSVRGEATLEVEPELCELTVIVQARDKDRIATLENLTRRNSQTLDELKAYGDAVEKLESSGFTVHPEQKPGAKDEKVRSYVGRVRIRVVVNDFTVLGEMVTRMGSGDMRSVDGPYWRLRRDSVAYRDARTRAVTEAVKRAHEYTAAIGSTLTGLVELADTGLSTHGAPPNAPRAMSFAMAGAAPGGSYQPPPLDLEPERQTVYASVEARFTASQPESL
jgi:uncharacterized protein YggE